MRILLILDVLSGIKKMKNNSEPKLNLTQTNKSNVPQSAIQIGRQDLSDASSLITQVPKYDNKIDIQNLTNPEEIEDFYDYTENCLLLISKMKMPPTEEIEHLRLDMPKCLLDNKKLAIFDLDETLIHCELKDLSKAEKVITIKLKDGNKARVRIYNNINNIINIIHIGRNKHSS